MYYHEVGVAKHLQDQTCRAGLNPKLYYKAVNLDSKPGQTQPFFASPRVAVLFILSGYEGCRLGQLMRCLGDAALGFVFAGATEAVANRQ